MHTHISRACGILGLVAWIVFGLSLAVNRAAHLTVVGVEVQMLIVAAGVMFSLMFWMQVVATAALKRAEQAHEQVYTRGVHDTLRALGHNPPDVVPMQPRRQGSTQQS